MVTIALFYARRKRRWKAVSFWNRTWVREAVQVFHSLLGNFGNFFHNQGGNLRHASACQSETSRYFDAKEASSLFSMTLILLHPFMPIFNALLGLVGVWGPSSSILLFLYNTYFFYYWAILLCGYRSMWACFYHFFLQKQRKMSKIRQKSPRTATETAFSGKKLPLHLNLSTHPTKSLLWICETRERSGFE